MSDTNILLNRAKSALLARDYQLAAKYYKTLIAENPDVIDYKIELGNLYVKSGKDDQALDVFKIIAKKDFDNLNVLMSMAGIYRRQKKFDDSVAVLEQALMVCNCSEKDHATINYNLGFTYRQMGNNEEAIKCFENVIEYNPEDVLAYNHLGAIHALKGDQAKAIEAYQRGLKFDPNHPILQFNLARSYAETGEISKALSYYEGALKAKPGWLDAIEEYANLLLKTNKVKEADDVVSNALKLNPNDVKMHTSMGHVYNRKSIFDNAEIEFKKALDGDEEYKSALTGLAHSLERQGKHEEAAETIKKASKLNPDDIAIIKQSAHVLLSANFLSAAYEKISRLWEINQNDLQTINLLGQYYIAKGDEGKIESCFDKIQKINPEYRDVFKDWGYRYLQKGDTRNAEQYLKTAISYDEKDSESMMFLGELYEHLKQPEKALEMYKRASHADMFNNRSGAEINRLTSEGVSGLSFNSADLKIEGLPPVQKLSADSVVETVEDNKIPDLLNDTSSTLNDDFEDSASEEISMAEDDSQFMDESESDGEDAKKAEDDGFDFDQFGMEKLAEDETDGIISVDELMKLDDSLDMNGSPDDFDDLVDDGSPIDEDDDPLMEFIPDGSDTSDEDVEPSFAPEEEIQKNSDEEPVFASTLADEEEETDTPDVMETTSWNKDERPVIRAEIPEEALKNIEGQIKAATDLAEKANEAAERAIKAAENLENSMQNVEEPEDEMEAPVDSEEIEERPEEAEPEIAQIPASELSPEELMLRRAIDMLPEIVAAIEDRHTLFKFKSSLEMFKTLREMLEYLPNEQKQEFLTSRNRLLLDYIISRLSGKPGLFSTVKALISSGLIHEDERLCASDKDGVELTKEVVEIVKKLTEHLDDETLRIVLKNESENLLKKL